MNAEEEIELERQLREIATREPPSTVRREGEMEGLAEGWLALGQLLDGAEQDFCPGNVVKQLRRRIVRRRLRIGGALLAAMLLLGVGPVWYLSRGLAIHDPGAVQGQPSVAIVHPAAAPAAPLPVGALPSEVTVEQSLDQGIAQVGQDVIGVESLGNRNDDLDVIDQQLVSFRQEVERDPL